MGQKRNQPWGLREEIAKAEWAAKNPTPPGMSKQEYADFRFNSALIEEDDFDMLVMGRTQGKGCYCFVNDLLRDKIEKYYRNYKYMVVDNEAGLTYQPESAAAYGRHTPGKRLFPPGDSGRGPHCRDDRQP